MLAYTALSMSIRHFLLMSPAFSGSIAPAILTVLPILVWEVRAVAKSFERSNGF